MRCGSCGGSGLGNSGYPDYTPGSCKNCGGSGQYGIADDDPPKRSSSLGYTPGPEPTTPEEIRKAKRATFVFYFIASMLISAMLGPGGLALWFMVVFTLGFGVLVHWVTSLWNRKRRKNAPKLD